MRTANAARSAWLVNAQMQAVDLCSRKTRQSLPKNSKKGAAAERSAVKLQIVTGSSVLKLL